MLLKSDIESELTIKLTLTFDDETVKTQTIRPGNILELTYIKDRNKYTKTGVVKEINILSSFKMDKPHQFINRSTLEICTNGKYFDNHDGIICSTAMLRMDFSKDFESDFEEVLTHNILDIKLLQTEEKMELQNLYDNTLSINNDENQWTEYSFNYLQSILRLTKNSLDNPNLSNEDASVVSSILYGAIMGLIPTDKESEPEPIEPDPEPVDPIEPEQPDPDDVIESEPTDPEQTDPTESDITEPEQPDPDPDDATETEPIIPPENEDINNSESEGSEESKVEENGDDINGTND